ncbi:SIR2 family protein [Nitrospinae bacterium AH-259-F20]|nr:SIR2 family protein [Nitrospinae bacterium AH-259-F20]
MLSVILGAGFSHVGGVPLASQLFDEYPEVDRITRVRLVQRVLARWEAWQARNVGGPEEYLAFLEKQGGGDWRDALWFVSLVIALRMGRVELVGMNTTITRHNIDRTTRIQAHEDFWTTIFKRTTNVGVITTNYDILIERGLRCQPRPRVPRPGFHYGEGPESLKGGGYPSYTHIRPIEASGSVPLYKLHGSISWAIRNGKLVRYHDCRPAIRGDAFIVAPIIEKYIPDYLRKVWDQAAACLSESNKWIIVGYSLPSYDLAVRNLLKRNSSHGPCIHIFDPNPDVASETKRILPRASVYLHPGLPDVLADLYEVLNDVVRDL